MKIKLLLKFSDMYETLGNIAIANRTEYCNKFGYELVVDDKPFDKSIAYNWMKFDAIERHLHDCDWLMWSDADSYIMNDEIDLERFLPEGKNIVCSFFKMKDFKNIDPNLYTLHTGNFFIRNCDWSFELLNKFKNTMHLAISKGEPMMDEYTLTSLYKTTPGYAEKFKLLKINKLFTIPHSKHLRYMELPDYEVGDFIVHYVTPIPYEQKNRYAESLHNESIKIWNRSLPVMKELSLYPDFVKIVQS